MTNPLSKTLLKNSYSHLKARMSEHDLKALTEEFSQLNQKATAILEDVAQQKLSYADYYAQGKASLIAVPEAQHPTQTCRFEYIQPTSKLMKEQLIPLCAEEIRQQISHSVVLFKDKCNLKSPRGGAFTAHQDIPAYVNYGPNIHVTAAVFLDAATAENGALEVAENYQELQGEGIEYVDTALGRLPIFATYQGGNKNGKIIDKLEKQLSWTPVYADAGDIILFNSYIPHRSAMNISKHTRRAFFFTFNLEQDGHFYESYYQTKRADFDNVNFHVATPTRHSGSV